MALRELFFRFFMFPATLEQRKRNRLEQDWHYRVFLVVLPGFPTAMRIESGYCFDSASQENPPIGILIFYYRKIVDRFFNRSSSLFSWPAYTTIFDLHDLDSAKPRNPRKAGPVYRVPPLETGYLFVNQVVGDVL